MLALMCCMVYVTKVIAVSTSIVQSPSTISDEPFTITVNVTGATAGTNYLRADLYRTDTKNYFGETDNTQYWYGGSDGKLYFPVTIESGTPLIATFSARLGNPSSTDYPGPGLYKLRIRRYTSSGNQGSEDPQPADINITKANPSPTPSPSPSPSPSYDPSPTPAPTLSTSQPPSPLPTKTLASPVMLATLRPELASPEAGTVSGESTIDLSSFGLLSPTPQVSAQPSTSSASLRLNESRARFAAIVGSGIILVASSLYLWYQKRMRGIIT